jgi:L-2,4-diaminobutyrate decarboxylase
MSSHEELSASRERIAAAYDPLLLKDTGHRLADLLATNLSRAENSEAAVLPWEDPEEGIDEALAILRAASSAAGAVPPTPYAETAQRFSGLVQTMLDRGLNLHDPRYIGHQVPAPVPLAGLFDAVGSVTNQVMATYEMGPWATSVEQAMVRELGGAIGWEPGTFAGLATHGGSLANLTALLTARNVSLEGVWQDGLGGRPVYPVLLVNADAHYSVARAAGILGLGSHSIVRVGIDAHRRMDPVALEAALAEARAEGRPVVAVSACACSTPFGAFDPLEEIADICARYEVWLHVDAAHGGAAVLSDQHRHLLAGIERADSFIMDAHKMLFVPGLCAFVFYRDKAHRFEAFQQDAPYLFDPAAPGLADYDSGMKTVECTKRAAAYGLWGVWSLFGRQLFADMVDVTFALGRTFYEKLTAAEDFVPLHEPQCNIVVFRHVPAGLQAAAPDEVGSFQLELRRRLIESGEFYIVPFKSDGVGALRVTIINPLTTPQHLDQLMDALRRHGRQLLAAGGR